MKSIFELNRESLEAYTKSKEAHKSFVEGFQKFVNERFKNCTIDGRKVAGFVDYDGNLRFRLLSKTGSVTDRSRIICTFYSFSLKGPMCGDDDRLFDAIVKSCHVEFVANDKE